MLKNSENDGTEEIGFVTPTLDQFSGEFYDAVWHHEAMLS